jgi:hypothetical protein
MEGGGWDAKRSGVEGSAMAEGEGASRRRVRAPCGRRRPWVAAWKTAAQATENFDASSERIYASPTAIVCLESLRALSHGPCGLLFLD